MNIGIKDSIPISVSFRGGRNYIQGSNLYAAATIVLEKYFQNNSVWINYMVFRRFSGSNCFMLLDNEKDLDGKDAFAEFTVQNNQKQYKGRILENGEPIIERVPFDEERIQHGAVIKNNTILQSDRTEYHPIEEIVSLTKYLHNHLMPLTKGKWIFSGLDLSSPFAKNNGLLYKITVEQNLGNKMTISQITEHDTIIGKIQFAVATI